MRPALPLLLTFLLSTQSSFATPRQAIDTTPQTLNTQSLATIVIPAGAKVEMAVTRPVWATTAAPGNLLYAETVFPVTVGNTMAIPSGTYVEGSIEALTRPTRKSQKAIFHLRFNKIIFSNGYTVPLASPNDNTWSPSLTVVTVQVSTANDLLLDNGMQITLTLQAPLSLNATQVAQAVPLSRAPNPTQFVSATLCRPVPGYPGTPGTPDTVIPGTPSTSVPGGPGMPDITIPGTPSTTIPGTPGTPDSYGISCPAPPLVLSSMPEMATAQAGAPPGPGAK